MSNFEPKNLPTYQELLNKIPKMVVKEKGLAIVAKDYREAKQFAIRKGLLNPLLTYATDSHTTIYFESDALKTIAYDELERIINTQFEEWEKNNSFLNVCKRFIKEKLAF